MKPLWNDPNKCDKMATSLFGSIVGITATTVLIGCFVNGLLLGTIFTILGVLSILVYVLINRRNSLNDAIIKETLEKFYKKRNPYERE